jgi:hypothetical protein
VTETGFAWVTGAPADYTMMFTADASGPHAIVIGAFEDQDQVSATARGLEGAELADGAVHAYCTLPEESDRVAVDLIAAGAQTTVEPGVVAFVASAGASRLLDVEPKDEREVAARIVFSAGGHGPRAYRFTGQCPVCGEFLGRINVLPREAMLIDTRELSCRCRSIPCRYCSTGRVRRPLTEHFDPERRAGAVPWFGYLVPCGACQASGTGPEVLMSHRALG